MILCSSAWFAGGGGRQVIRDDTRRRRLCGPRAACAVIATPRQQARVQVDMPEDLPLVSIDGQQIEQVLFNFSRNALKYGPRATHGVCCS